MNKIRTAVIGIGSMGSAHAMDIFLAKAGELQLVAVCDINPAREVWARENLPGVKFFSDYIELLDNAHAEAVIIATPHYIHPEIAIAALNRGLHVMTEKPAGVYTLQVDEMNHAAAVSGKVFAIMYQERSVPIYKKVREMVKNGTIGELRRFVWINTTWYRTQFYYDSGGWRATWAGEGGGVLINQCPHNLDIWQWIFGLPARVRGFCGYGKYHDIEVEDDFTAYGEYENGATAVFIATTGECPGTNRMEITGDMGKIVVEDGKIFLWKTKSSVSENCRNSKKFFDKVESDFSEIIPDMEESGHKFMLKNFAGAILRGEKLVAPGVEGIAGLSLSNAIHLSDWMGETVDLPIDGKLYKRLLDEKIKSSKVKKPDVSGEIADLSKSFN